MDGDEGALFKHKWGVYASRQRNQSKLLSTRPPCPQILMLHCGLVAKQVVWHYSPKTLRYEVFESDSPIPVSGS